MIFQLIRQFEFSQDLISETPVHSHNLTWSHKDRNVHLNITENMDSDFSLVRESLTLDAEPIND